MNLDFMNSLSLPVRQGLWLLVIALSFLAYLIRWMRKKDDYDHRESVVHLFGPVVEVCLILIIFLDGLRSLAASTYIAGMICLLFAIMLFADGKKHWRQSIASYRAYRSHRKPEDSWVYKVFWGFISVLFAIAKAIKLKWLELTTLKLPAKPKTVKKSPKKPSKDEEKKPSA